MLGRDVVVRYVRAALIVAVFALLAAIIAAPLFSDPRTTGHPAARR